MAGKKERNRKFLPIFTYSLIFLMSIPCTLPEKRFHWHHFFRSLNLGQKFQKHLTTEGKSKQTAIAFVGKPGLERHWKSWC